MNQRNAQRTYAHIRTTENEKKKKTAADSASIFSISYLIATNLDSRLRFLFCSSSPSTRRGVGHINHECESVQGRELQFTCDKFRIRLSQI